MQINPRVAIVREAIDKVVFMLAQKKIRVTQQGSQAFVEYDNKTLAPKRVNLPYLPDNATEELIVATQGFLDHEIGHVLETDPQALVEARKLNLDHVHNLVEDTFIERRMEKRFEGSAYNLDATRYFFINNRVPARLAEASTPEELQNILVMPMLRAMAGQVPFENFMRDKWDKVSGLVKALGDDMPDLLRNVNSSMEALKVAKIIDSRISDAVKNPPPMSAPPQMSEPKESGEKGQPKPSEGKKEQKSEEKPEQDKGENKKAESKPEPEKGEGEDQDDQEPQESESGKSEEKPAEDKDEGEGESEKPSEQPAEDPSEGQSEPDEGQPQSGEDEPSGGEDSSGSDDQEGEEQGNSDPSEESSEQTSGTSGQSGEDADAQDEPVTPPESLPESDDEHEVELEEHASGQAGFGVGQNDNIVQVQELKKSDVMNFDDEVSKAISDLAAEQGMDSEYLPFTRDYDYFGPIHIDPDLDEAAIKKMSDAVDHMVAPMQKDLERLIAARSAAVWTGGFKSGRMHGASLARVSTGAVDIFRRKQETQTKNVAVSLLCDCSGSMLQYGQEGSKMEIAARSAYALAQVLDRIGVANEVLGFTTGQMPPEGIHAILDEYRKRTGTGKDKFRYSREDTVIMLQIKDWAERMSNVEVRRRFAQLQSPDESSANIDGESVQIAAHRLSQRREARKVLFVLSDGLPAANGVMAQLRGHLKTVVENATKAGIDVIGIGICSEAVKEFYPKYVVLNSVDKLPGVVMRELQAVMLR